MIEKVLKHGQVLLKYPGLYPDIENLIAATRLRLNLKNSDISEIEKLKIANTFLDYDLIIPFKNEDNKELVKSILDLKKITLLDDVQKIQFLIKLIKN